MEREDLVTEWTCLYQTRHQLPVNLIRAHDSVTATLESAYDWELFCELAYDDGKWPENVRNFPTDATTLAATNDGEEVPHHALLDAKIIANMFTPSSK